MEIVTHVLTSEQPALQEDEARKATARKNIGLDNVDNTADIDKPVSNDTQAALDMKADKVAGGTAGNLAMMDGEGNMEDSGIDASRVVEDGSYRHIDVTDSSVTDGVSTFSKYEHPEYELTEPSAIKVGRDATGHVVAGDALGKADVGLGNVDNTADLDKPISTATQTALDGKQPNLPTPVVGKFLTNDANGLKWGDATQISFTYDSSTTTLNIDVR